MKPLVLFFLPVLLAPAQQIKLEPGAVQPPPPLEALPGDSVEIDPATGDIVAKSNGVTVRLPLENWTEPRLSVTLARTGKEFTYTYSLANGDVAQQWIPAFSLQCPFPDKVRAVAPMEWRQIKGGTAVYRRALNFVHVVRDDDLEHQLSAGKSAGPFNMTSPLWPGLTGVTVAAAGRRRLAGEPSPGERLEALSPWAYDRVRQIDSEDRRRKSLTTIGPKVAPDENSIASIRQELASAVALPEFANLRKELTLLSERQSKESLRQGLRNLNGSGFQNLFFEALLWRLEEAN